MARVRFNLLALPSQTTDSTSFYRCIGPLHALRRQRPSLNVVVVEQLNWASLSAFDAVFMQRPISFNQLNIARMAAQHGIPIWVEYDDNFFSVPRDNPHHDQYMTPEVHQNIIRICSVADIVTVSTEALAQIYRQFAKNVRVVPNALMANMVGGIPDHGTKTRMPIVMWRGSMTHARDVDIHTEAMVEVASRHPELRWAFQGYAPYKAIEAIGPRAASGKMLDQVEYFAMLAASMPRVFMVPLADNSFNRCKSNIAAIEAIYAGSVAVVPDWPEWQIPGVLRYGKDATFAEQLENAVSMSEEEHNEAWTKGKNFIDNQLSIDTVNAKRNAILTELEDASFSMEARAAKRKRVAPKLVIEPVAPEEEMKAG